MVLASPRDVQFVHLDASAGLGQCRAVARDATTHVQHGARIGRQRERPGAGQRALHPAITTPLIDRIIDVAAAAGAIGGKALGASGGGCVLLVAAHGFEEPIRRAVQSLATPISFAIDHQGFAWWPPGAPLAPPHT